MLFRGEIKVVYEWTVYEDGSENQIEDEKQYYSEQISVIETKISSFLNLLSVPPLLTSIEVKATQR